MPAPAPAFHDPAKFPFVAPLEARWPEILAEYGRAVDLLSAWPEKKLCERGWEVLALYSFPRGEPIAENIARCPLTARLVADHVPRHGAAGFSVLAPQTRINPHTGYAGEFLRCHLPLLVPPGDCRIRVGGETRAWLPGRALVFDDRLDHEAWNLTAEARVVLLFDFVP